MSRSGASSLKEVRLQKEMDKILAEKETIRVELQVLYCLPACSDDVIKCV